MILEKKEIAYSSSSQLVYKVDDDKFMREVVLKIDESYKKYLVFKKEVSKQTPMDKPKQLEKKEFDLTSEGFNEATKYFEKLINDNDPSRKKSEPKRPNPIGILCMIDEKTWDLKLQDGRNIEIKLPSEAVELKDNIITFLKDGNLGDSKNSFFKRNESFFYDQIEGNDSCYGVFPISDKKGGQNRIIKGNPTQPGNPTPKMPIELQEKMAAWYGFQDYDSLIKYYDGSDNLVNELYNELPITNRKEFFRAMDLNENIPIESFRNLIKNP